LRDASSVDDKFSIIEENPYDSIEANIH